jgi:gas vesicle structural protein
MQLDSGNSGHILIDVLDRVLDKGIVIDAAVRVSIVGVELLGVDARVVVASIETYLRHSDTIAYTELAAAPKRPLPPPLYAEPLEGAASGDALNALDPARAQEPAPDAALPAAGSLPVEPGMPDPDPASRPADAPAVPEPLEDG